MSEGHIGVTSYFECYVTESFIHRVAYTLRTNTKWGYMVFGNDRSIDRPPWWRRIHLSWLSAVKKLWCVGYVPWGGSPRGILLALSHRSFTEKNVCFFCVFTSRGSKWRAVYILIAHQSTRVRRLYNKGNCYRRAESRQTLPIHRTMDLTVSVPSKESSLHIALLSAMQCKWGPVESTRLPDAPQQ